jgi:anti-sigma B factor antagonist
MEFGIEVVRSRDQSITLAVTGDLDVYTAPRLRDCLLDLLAQGHRAVAVDLNAVEFVDSAGLGVLIAALRRFGSDSGLLSLVCTSAPIIRLLELTGLTSVFTIVASAQEVTGPELAGS